MNQEPPTYPAVNNTNPAAPENNHKSRRRLSLIGGALALIIVIVALFFALGGNKKNDDLGGGDKEATTYDRPGYDRKTLPPSIADPEALTAKANSAPVHYENSSVIQACNILTLSDIHTSGQHLFPNSLTTPFERNYFDGKGKATITPSKYSLPTTGGNECRYTLTNAGVIVDVFQTPYTSQTAIDEDLTRDYQALPDKDGIKMFTQQANDHLSHYSFRKGDLGVRVTITMSATDKTKTPPSAIMDKLSGAITKNINQESKQPAGPATFTYDSPIFKKTAAKPCEIITNDDFRKIFGVDASPLANEKFGSSIGLLNFSTTGGKNENVKYASTDCTHRSTEDASGATGILRAVSDSFESDEAAHQQLSAQKTGPFAQNIKEISAKIGDEAFFGNIASGNDMITFRQGRFVVSISAASSNSNITNSYSAQQKIDVLVPLAQKIAAHLKSQG